MELIEDLPRNEEADDEDDEDEDEDEDEDDEDEEGKVSFNREDFDHFLKQRGGVGMIETISDIWNYATTIRFTRTQLHFLIIGNGAKYLSDEEWDAIVDDDDEDEDEDDDDDEDEDDEEGEMPQSLRITIEDNSRTVMFTTFEDIALDAQAIAAATKFQSLWRGHKARETLMEKRAVHILCDMKIGTTLFEIKNLH